MADDYADVVELGAEGLDLFADKFHDRFHDGVHHGFSKLKAKRKKGRGDQQQHHGQESTREDRPNDLDGYRSDDIQDRGYDKQPKGRRGSDSRWDRGGGYDDDFTSRRDDAPRDRGRGSDPDPYYYDQSRGFDPRLDPRRRDSGVQYGAYPVAGMPPPAPQQPPPVGYAAPLPPYAPEDSLVNARRGSLPRNKRSPSYSPPRRRSRNLDYAPPPSPRRRRRRSRSRSKSPSGNGLASSVVGALAGGLAGNEMSKGDTFTTVAAAVIGAVSAREAGKFWDEKKGKLREKEEKLKGKIQGRSDQGRDRRRDQY